MQNNVRKFVHNRLNNSKKVLALAAAEKQNARLATLAASPAFTFVLLKDSKPKANERIKPDFRPE
jgi:hypothetical protein